jgi:ATP-dependent protease Clp ATPase subunit
MEKPCGLFCSFCGKNKDEVAWIICGPGVSICTECVDCCNELIADRNTTLGGYARPSDVPRRAEAESLKSKNV